MKKVFIDCGANLGQSIELFIETWDNPKDYEIHCFEANQDFEAVWTAASVLTEEEIQSRMNDNNRLRSQQQVTLELRHSRAATGKVKGEEN